MAQLAISLAVTAATTGLQLAFAPKPKKPSPIDRGKLDDHRISWPALGASIPKGWGTFRCAPIWIDGTPTDHRVELVQGSSGGKGGGGAAPTADERRHVYVKSLIGVFHNGLIYKGVPKVWLNGKLALNSNIATREADTSAMRGEAEHGVFGGGASVAVQSECSGGKKVIGIGLGGHVTLTIDVLTTGNHEVACYYTSTSDLTFKVSVNGGALSDLFCPASGAAGEVTSEVITLAMTAGANTIRFENAGAACPDLDRIDVAPQLVFAPLGPMLDPRSFTGITRAGSIGPIETPDIAWPTTNEQPQFSEAEGGVTNGAFSQSDLAEWGNPTIRIYNASELQDADPIIIALRGLDLAPGYRGLGIIAIDNIQLRNGELPNVTVEVEQGQRELTAIVTDIYNEVNVPAADLDLTALNGLMLGDTSGFDVGTYGAVNWAGENNATETGNGAITKTSGTENTWNSYANAGLSVAAGENAAIRFTAGPSGTYMLGFSYTATPGATLPNPYNQVPFAVLLNKNSNPSQESKNAIQLSIGGVNNSFDVGTWSPGDQFQVEYRNGRFSAYQNGRLLSGFIPPVPSTFPLNVMFIGYALGGGPSAASIAAGANIGDEPIVSTGGGLFMESPRQAGELIVELMTRFQFDLPEVDGMVKAVLRNSPSEVNVPYQDLRAHKGDARPGEDMIIQRINPLTLPKVTAVSYSNPAMGFHTDTQSEVRLFGPQRGRHDEVLAMIESSYNMKNLAVTISNRMEVEGQTYKLLLPPKYTKIHQGTVMTVTSRSGVSHMVRVKEIGLELPLGIISVEAVRQDAAAFSVNAVPAGVDAGIEVPVVAVPGNTRGVIIDGPLLRPLASGDAARSILYVGMCGRGSGAWPAGFLYREYPRESGNYSLLASSDKPAGIGVTDGTLGTVADTEVVDNVNSVTFNFNSNTELESITEAEMLANPELNLLAVINPSGEVEYVQFADATPEVATVPFITRYTISTLLRGRNGTESKVGTHTAADDVVVINSALTNFSLSASDIGQPITLKFLTAGQGIDTIEPFDRTFVGNVQTQVLTGAVGGTITPGEPTVPTTIPGGSIGLGSLGDIPSQTFVGRNTAGTGTPETLSMAVAKPMLNLAGANSGDVTLAGQTYLSIVGQQITANAVDLSGSHVTGTLATARFPATLPALSGANLTSLNASALGSGTVPDGRFPATLPAVSGVNLTNLNASNLSSGTLLAARMPALTGEVISTVGTVATSIAAQNSAFWRGKVSDETGAGLWVFNDAPVFATSISTPSIVATANLTIAPTGDVVFDPAGNDLLPSVNYDLNIGSLSKKFLTFHCAELWVETLVAQDTMATMGGRFIVPKGATLLSLDLLAAGTTITVKHNNLANGDRIWMESNGKFEMMAVTSGAGGSAGAYTYTVTRNLDGTGANDWFAGDSIINTGTTGDGFIELYAYAGRFAGTGPTIVGNVRTGTTYNNIEPRWAIGNLNGLYGYSATTYGAAFGVPSAAWIKIDPTNGVRLGNDTTARVSMSPTGVLSIVDGSLTMSGSGYLGIGPTAPTRFLGAGGIWQGLTAGVAKMHVGTVIPDTQPSSYTNTGGSGDRAGVVTISSDLTVGGGAISGLINGSTVDSAVWFTTQAVAGKFIKFDFGASYSPVVNEAKWYQHSASNTMGDWKWQGSNDDSGWTDIGASFTLGGATQPQTITTLSGNTTGYRYYRLLGVSGNWSDGPWCAEFEFKLYVVGVLLKGFSWDNATFRIVDGVMTMSGADASLAIGTTPPTSASAGTGIWLDRTGLYGLGGDLVQFNLSATDGVLRTRQILNLSDTGEIKLTATENATGAKVSLTAKNAAANQEVVFDVRASNTSLQYATLDKRVGTLGGFTIGSQNQPGTLLDVYGGAHFRGTIGSGGVEVGSPTGGNKGAGTINVAGDIYKNNLAYGSPDFVFEHWATGSIEMYADKEGAREYKGLMPLPELREFIRAQFHLPGFGQKAGHGLFSGGERLLAAVEELHLYIFQLEDRINQLSKP